MYLTQSNARQYLGKSLDAERRLFHHYPLTVVQLPDGGLYYRDGVGYLRRAEEDRDAPQMQIAMGFPTLLDVTGGKEDAS